MLHGIDSFFSFVCQFHSQFKLWYAAMFLVQRSVHTSPPLNLNHWGTCNLRITVGSSMSRWGPGCYRRDFANAMVGSGDTDFSSFSTLRHVCFLVASGVSFFPCQTATGMPSVTSPPILAGETPFLSQRNPILHQWNSIGTYIICRWLWE